MSSNGRPSGVIRVDGQETIAAAALRMSEHGIGCLPVTDEGGKLIGIISERDILTRVVARGGNPRQLRVADCMTRSVVSCPRGTPMHRVRQIMSQSRIRHLPIVDGDVAVGIISSREVIADQLAQDRKMRNLTIFALAKLAESRDPDTGGHLERVQSYAALLSRQLLRQRHSTQIDAHFVRLMYTSSPLHDIGKVGVPDGVLLKPGPLSKEEFEVMKTHCRKGAETIDSVLARFPHAEFLRMGRSIAAWHHERYDGTGYPDGLSGEEIPLSARIFSVCDVYDALVSKRVYKEPLPHCTAVDIVTGATGKQFDPSIVHAFLGCRARFAAIENRHEARMTAA